MIKVINISSMTVEIKGVKIKPKKIHIFDEVTLKDRARISTLCAVGLIKAYDLGLMEETKTEQVKPKTNTRNATVTTRQSSTTEVSEPEPETVTETTNNETAETTTETQESTTPKTTRKK